jgi:hypothetical protein
MASSRPTPFVIDDDEDWGTLSVLPPSSSRPSTTSSVTSGEFNAFTFVGSAIAGGGPKRRLWVLKEGLVPCLGKVGANNKICIRPCVEGFDHCGTARHSVKSQVQPDFAHIRITDNQVYAAPTWNLSSFLEKQRGSILSIQLTAADWEKDFKSIESGEYPEWLVKIMEEDVQDNSSVSDQVSVQLLSPVAAKSKQGVFELLPTFSFESANSEGNTRENEFEVDADTRLFKVENKIEKLKSKLNRPFRDIDASYSVMVNDIQKLHDRVKTLTLLVGSFPSKMQGLPISLCRMYVEIKEKTNGLVIFKDHLSPFVNKLSLDLENLKKTVNSMQEEFGEFQDLPLQFEQWTQASNRNFEAFNRRFASIKSVLSRNLSAYDDDKENVKQSSLSADPDQISSDILYRQILSLEETIKLLESRVVGAGVQLGGLVFQSFDDLLAWVKIKVPKGRFGVFVDGHSFLEFFSLLGHVDTEAGTAAFSHSQKAGFSTYIEAQLAISFKNLFPIVFGKGGSPSMDDAECLPAISSGDKWNNGSTGIHHQLMRNMNDVSYQLDSSIKKVLKDHSDARQLAFDCVTASKRFVIDLIAFMSQEYSTWQQRGFSKKDAWLVVSQIVRRIFEDLQSARISARNAQDFDDIDFTTATFLYATLRCHDVMEGYVKHQFHAHPHVSSVITRHLAANFVKPEQSQDSKISSMDTKVKALGAKLDSYVSKLELFISKEKAKHKQDKHDNKEHKDKDKGKNGRGRQEETDH